MMAIEITAPALLSVIIECLCYNYLLSHVIVFKCEKEGHAGFCRNYVMIKVIIFAKFFFSTDQLQYSDAMTCCIMKLRNNIPFITLICMCLFIIIFILIIFYLFFDLSFLVMLVLCCCFTSTVNIYGHTGTVSWLNHTFPGQAKTSQAVNQY